MPLPGKSRTVIPKKQPIGTPSLTGGCMALNVIITVEAMAGLSVLHLSVDLHTA